MHARSTRQLLACIALVLTSPVAAWWLMDVTTAADLGDPDHVFRPLPIDPALEVVIGAMAVALTTAAVLELALFEPAPALVRRWRPVVGPLMAAGIMCGAGWAILTAPVIGATIGAGAFILTAPPVILALLGWSAVRWYRVLRRPARA